MYSKRPKYTGECQSRIYNALRWQVVTRIVYISTLPFMFCLCTVATSSSLSLKIGEFFAYRKSSISHEMQTWFSKELERVQHMAWQLMMRTISAINSKYFFVIFVWKWTYESFSGLIVVHKWLNGMLFLHFGSFSLYFIACSFKGCVWAE